MEVCFFYPSSVYLHMKSYCCWMNLFSLLQFTFKFSFSTKKLHPVILVTFSWNATSVNNPDRFIVKPAVQLVEWHLNCLWSWMKTGKKTNSQTQLHSLISSMTTVLSIATCTTNLLHVSNTASFLKAHWDSHTFCVLPNWKDVTLNGSTPPVCRILSFLFTVWQWDGWIHGGSGKERHLCIVLRHKNAIASVTRFLSPLSHHYTHWMVVVLMC